VGQTRPAITQNRPCVVWPTGKWLLPFPQNISAPRCTPAQSASSLTANPTPVAPDSATQASFIDRPPLPYPRVPFFASCRPLMHARPLSSHVEPLPPVGQRWGAAPDQMGPDKAPPNQPNSQVLARCSRSRDVRPES
jgi:hypothetical protein